MTHWFWMKKTEDEWTPIYAESEQQAKNKRSAIAKNPNIEGITPVRPIGDTTLPMELKKIIKRGAKNGNE